MRLDPRVKERLKQTFVKEMSAGKTVVRITSAYRLSPDEQEKILSHFPDFASSTVENVVDPSLLGGFIVQQGSQAIDLSLRSVLQTLQKTLV
jgi:F-type H+-transporting ATPase subunit delta